MNNIKWLFKFPLNTCGTFSKKFVSLTQWRNYYTASIQQKTICISLVWRTLSGLSRIILIIFICSNISVAVLQYFATARRGLNKCLPSLNHWTLLHPQSSFTNPHWKWPFSFWSRRVGVREQWNIAGIIIQATAVIDKKLFLWH